jgi:hypothetical protein
VEPVEPGIIQVGPAKDQQIVRHEVHIVDGPAVMGLTVSDEDALWGIISVSTVWIDGPYAGPELGPGKQRGAQVNGGGIDDFDLWRLLQAAAPVQGRAARTAYNRFFQR